MNILYIDTETTGLNPEVDELLSISVVDDYGQCVFHSLCKPEKHTSWEDAEQINHITPEMVDNAPSYKSLKAELLEILKCNLVVAYNMKFDSAFLKDVLKESKLECAMEAFKAIKKISKKHISLINAISVCNPNFTYKAHNSIDDCLACREVWNYLKHNQSTFTVKDFLNVVATYEDATKAYEELKAYMKDYSQKQTKEYLCFLFFSGYFLDNVPYKIDVEKSYFFLKSIDFELSLKELLKDING